MIKSEKAFHIKPDQDLLPLKDQTIIYSCGAQSIIVIANDPLTQNSLATLNEVYQRNNVYLTYHAETAT